ncbi:BCCT family transporter [Oerskovia enterophila]|uniref:Glycine betaine transporter OpuD n=1 Tax=Oerskovia enterophila TaxID=43678 RepID=A0A163RFL9_9CELL|nr:BCCT family transporter [Oerskovia enterophila]KZM35161.1 glycine betaine transporter OpuD [Oerskovia enterophila]OCI30146.1 glycine betaine transporter OpuD [Oerskovia enterophila]
MSDDGTSDHPGSGASEDETAPRSTDVPASSSTPDVPLGADETAPAGDSASSSAPAPASGTEAGADNVTAAVAVEVPVPPGRMYPRVFYPAAGLILLFVLLAMVFTDGTTAVLSTLQADVIGAFGWYYVLIVAGFVIFALWMGLSRFGDIVLGKDDETPLFRLPVWFAMLFATGMGIGLVYWGAAEPLTHYASPKPGVTGDPAALAQAAMGQSYLHWGVHAWAIYVVAGLALAYAIHRKGRPVSIRWALEPLLGDRVKGRLGDVVDVVAVLGTVFGVATSLGFGVLQIGAGLGFLNVAEPGLALQIGLIIGITAVATLSVASGLGRGMKWLSNGNMVLAGVLALTVLVVGPTLFLLRDYVQSMGYYLQNVIRLTFDTTAFQGDAGLEWQSSWTIFYWGWWISWAPFVGVFIARISRGRTIREFVMGTLLVPTLVTFLWFSIFGGSALYRQIFGDGGLIGADGSVDTDTVLFQLLGDLPGGPVLTVLAIVLIGVFFVTSADSGSFVVGMLTSGGDPHPAVWNRILWAVLSGLLAMALLISGGLTALQTAAILIALPFSVVMIGMALSTVIALREEHSAILRAERAQARLVLTQHVTRRVTETISEQWDELYGSDVPGPPRPADEQRTPERRGPLRGRPRRRADREGPSGTGSRGTEPGGTGGP